MLTLREEVVGIIQAIPDDELMIFIDILNVLKDAMPDITSEKKRFKEKMDLLHDIKQFKGIIHSDINVEEALLRARDEKYTRIHAY